MQLLESPVRSVERWLATFWRRTGPSEEWRATSANVKCGRSVVASSPERTLIISVDLTAAFTGVDGAFILVPPNFDPSPDFGEARAVAATLSGAIVAARPQKVVYLSTIGAQATRANLLTQHTIIEQALRKLPVAITFLRPGWFMENSSWDVGPAKSGAIQSFLQPLDKPVPMVATADIGRLAAELLQESWDGHRVVELEGPHRVTPNEIAATFARLLAIP